MASPKFEGGMGLQGNSKTIKSACNHLADIEGKAARLPPGVRTRLQSSCLPPQHLYLHTEEIRVEAARS